MEYKISIQSSMGGSGHNYSRNHKDIGTDVLEKNSAIFKSRIKNSR